MPLLAAAILAAPSPDFGVADHDHDHDHDHNDHEHHDHDHADEARAAEAIPPAEPEKKCELVRSSSATSPECFLEPECEEECRPTTRTVCSPYEDKECKSLTIPR